MPEMGPRAPARTLVAVRAMVPVTQMPPNSAEPILAKPCATSSQLERWRRPVMPSATTADNSDSMAPSSANAIASGNTASTFATENVGNAGKGNSRGMPPQRVPMVSTGMLKAQVTMAAMTTAIRMPGQVGRNRFNPMMIRIYSAASTIADTLAVGTPCASAISFGSSSPGSLAVKVIPNRSLSWLAKMITAMPAVKPTVTG